jgi:hypothetical protein
MVSSDRPTSEDDLIKIILAAKDPSAASKGYAPLLKRLANEDLPRLQSHASDTISIQAAWMHSELTVPVKEPVRAVRPDRESLAWFIGFVEGRTRVHPPKWWAEAILDARANRRGNVYAGGLNIWGNHLTGDPIVEMWPAKATIEQKDGQLFVRTGKEAAHIPDDVPEKVKKQKGLDYEVRALITPTRCYVAMHESVGYSYRLGCVERSPAGVRWTSDVWGSWWSASTGVSRHWVEIVEQGDRVVVFGIASVGFYVEGFRVTDGTNLFRFSNTYASLDY